LIGFKLAHGDNDVDEDEDDDEDDDDEDGNVILFRVGLSTILFC